MQRKAGPSGWQTSFPASSHLKSDDFHVVHRHMLLEEGGQQHRHLVPVLRHHLTQPHHAVQTAVHERNPRGQEDLASCKHKIVKNVRASTFCRQPIRRYKNGFQYSTADPGQDEDILILASALWTVREPTSTSNVFLSVGGLEGKRKGPEGHGPGPSTPQFLENPIFSQIYRCLGASEYRSCSQGVSPRQNVDRKPCLAMKLYGGTVSIHPMFFLVANREWKHATNKTGPASTYTTTFDTKRKVRVCSDQNHLHLGVHNCIYFVPIVALLTITCPQQHQCHERINEQHRHFLAPACFCSFESLTWISSHKSPTRDVS